MTIIRQVVTALTRAGNRQRPQDALVRGSGILGAGQFGSPGGPLNYLAAYGTVGWLFAVVSRIADSTASAKWRLYRTGVSERQEIVTHPVLNIWNNPNPFSTKHLFIETSQQHLDLVGEAWWLLVRDGRGQIAELWPVRPDRMAPVPHSTEWLTGYIYRAGGQSILLDKDDIIFLRLPNPIDPYRGMGPVQTILNDLDSERYAALWNRNFFVNSAEPGGIIELPDALSDAEFEQLVLRWREQHQGVANAHRVAILERGKWVDRKFSMRDMQFEQMRKVNRDAILGAYGFPKHLLGITDDVNRAVAEAAEVMFSRWVITPRLERIKQALNEQLIPFFGDGLEFDFDDIIPEDKEHDLKVALGAYELGIATKNEARQFIGLGAVDDGDSYNPYAGIKQKALAPTPYADPSDEMADAWERRLSEEVGRVIAYLQRVLPRSVKSVMDDYFWDWWERWGEEIIAELTAAFSTGYRREGPFTTLAHEIAVRYAQERAGRLIRIDGDMNLVEATQRRVAELVSESMANGDSIDKLAKRLRGDFAFSRRRAETIARTETATAWGQATIDAGKAQGREEKRWLTQGYGGEVERLCPTGVCPSNEQAGWIAIDDAFPSGVQTIPAHVNCRCAVNTRHKSISAVEAGVAEPQCPKCKLRLPVSNLRGSAIVYCRRCKETVPVSAVAPTIVRKTVERDEHGYIVAVREERDG